VPAGRSGSNVRLPTQLAFVGSSASHPAIKLLCQLLLAHARQRSVSLVPLQNAQQWLPALHGIQKLTKMPYLQVFAAKWGWAAGAISTGLDDHIWTLQGSTSPAFAASLFKTMIYTPVRFRPALVLAALSTAVSSFPLDQPHLSRQRCHVPQKDIC